MLLTRLALQLYRQRPDLQAAFPDLSGPNRLHFARWFTQQARDENQIDEFFIQPLRLSLTKTAGHIQSPVSSLEFPPLNAPTAGRSAGLYLSTRNFLNEIGLGQRLRAIVGPERVLKLRQAMVKPQPAPVSPLPLPPAPTPAAPEALFGLNLVGYLDAETGMGEGGRSILRALAGQSFPVAYTLVHGADGSRKNDQTIRHFTPGHPYNINMYFVNADQSPVIYRQLGPSFFQGKYNISLWMWELAEFPSFWYDSFQFFDEIWTGTTFVQNAVAQVSPLPVVNVRLPISVPPPDPTITRAYLNLPVDKFIFVFVFVALSFVERKNPFDLIEAYRRAFEPHFKDTTLVIKATKLEQFPHHHQAIQEAMRSVNGILIDRYLDRHELNGLFNVCDTCLSLHRSEGFGMTLAEAMCLGKPVIATHYSGPADFMTVQNSYPVAYQLVEIEQDYGPYKKGQVWAQPDIDEAARLMQHVVSHPEEARRKGQLARNYMLQNYSPQAVAQIIINRLEMVQHFPRRH